MLQYALFDLARRLRAIGVSVGVSAEDREALLGHANHSIAGHYQCRRRTLLEQTNLLLNRSETQTVLRLGDRRRTSIVGVQQPRNALGFAHQPGRVKWERCITRSTEIPEFKEYLVFMAKSLIVVDPRARTLRVPPTFPQRPESSSQTSDRRGALTPA
jgi:hypothetical protein